MAAADTHAFSPPECADPDEMKMQRFLWWLEENGATFSSALRVNAGSRQMHATRAFVQGQLLMHIPKSLLLTREVARQSETGKLIDQQGCAFGPYEYIAAFLLQVKREGGFWKPYIDILPEDFSGHPLLFSERDLEHLRGSHLFGAVYDAQAFNRACYNQLPASIRETHTLDEFTWARCVVITRAFGVKFGGAPSAGLVPLADMADHSPENTGRWIFESENGFTITAARPLTAGAVLLNSYGLKSNAHFLLTYGFCLEQNDRNEVEVLLPCLPDDHPFAAHTGKYGAAVAGMRAFKVRRSCIDGPASAIFSYLRLTHSDAPLRVGNEDADLNKSSNLPPLSRDNEIRALETLADACARRLREYPTSIEDDDALLKDPASGCNVRNMVMVRRDEKAILQFFLRLTRIALPLLRGESCDVTRHAAPGSEYADYFSELARHLGLPSATSGKGELGPL